MNVTHADPVPVFFCCLPLAIGVLVFIGWITIALLNRFVFGGKREAPARPREAAGIGYTAVVGCWGFAVLGFLLVVLAYALSDTNSMAGRWFDSDVLEKLLVVVALTAIPLTLLTLARQVWLNRRRLAASIQYAHEVVPPNPLPREVNWQKREERPASPSALSVARAIPAPNPTAKRETPARGAGIVVLGSITLLFGIALFAGFFTGVRPNEESLLQPRAILWMTLALGVVVFGLYLMLIYGRSAPGRPAARRVPAAGTILAVGLALLAMAAIPTALVRMSGTEAPPAGWVTVLFFVLIGAFVIGLAALLRAELARSRAVLSLPPTVEPVAADLQHPQPSDPVRTASLGTILPYAALATVGVLTVTVGPCLAVAGYSPGGLIGASSFGLLLLGFLALIVAIARRYLRTGTSQQATTADMELPRPLPGAPIILTPEPAPAPSESRPCPKCGRLIAAGAPEGLCPRCLLGDLLPVPERLSPTIAHGPFIPPAVEEVAEFFPHLEIKQIIGQGGMGAVYLARQPSLDRLVALKLIRDHEEDPTFAERFAREARAMARLNHPNIVTVHESGVAGGLPYLVMEYVDGVTLRDAMRAKTLTPAEALKIIPQVCDALEYAHAQGVVHRDVKPENILLDRFGKVKIADFGLAKMADAGGVSLTGTQQAMGTPHYMAPEQWERPGEVDHRADIYALGVVLYELLTGELPLGRFDPPSVKARMDARIDELVLRALAKEPGRRFQHASDVKLALVRLGEGGWVAVGTYREFKSKTTFLGWPLVHVVGGRDPVTGRGKVAKGWIAIGDSAAVGVLAIAGGHAYGGLAIAGGGAFGVIALAGGYAVGLIGLAGGLAAGLLIAGAGGVAAAGGVALAGGFAIGTTAIAGGVAVGMHVLDSTHRNLDVVEHLTGLWQQGIVEPLRLWWNGPPTPTTAPYLPPSTLED